MNEFNHGTRTEAFDEDTGVSLPIAVEDQILKFTRGVHEYRDSVCRGVTTCRGDKQTIVRGSKREQCYIWV